jgi:hypothetical protein
MDKSVKEFIEQNIDFIDNGEFTKLIEKCPKTMLDSLISTFNEAGIPLEAPVSVSKKNKQLAKDHNLDQRVLDMISKVTLTETTKPVIIKRHFNKEKFIRYDIGIGTAGVGDADNYEINVALPAYERLKTLSNHEGWKAMYVPFVKINRGFQWTDFYVQIRIPTSSL